MKYYLIFQYPYDFTEIALCSNGNIVSSIQESKLTAVQLTIPNIEKILNNNNLTLQDIEYIAVNTGPGPYNTLRALITTANGIHFVKQTPLISLSALDLLLIEQTKPSLAILNAFAGHVFYAFSTSQTQEQGYCSLKDLVQKINNQSEQLQIIGNGATMHLQYLQQESPSKITLPKTIAPFNQLKTLAKQAHQKFINKKTEPSYLIPKYLHSPAVK